MIYREKLQGSVLKMLAILEDFQLLGCLVFFPALPVFIK